MKSQNLLFLTLLAGLLSVASQAAAQTPNMPETGPFSVQMFIGGTTQVYLCVNPPTTYTDGTPIPFGTPVTIRLYRSMDNGASYSTPVSIMSGGTGWVGQGAAGTQEKPWIDITAEVPVDNQPPYTVYLAASAVVGTGESLANVANLSFAYYPGLTRYALPSDVPGNQFAGGSNSNNQNPSAGPLTGTWNLNDSGTLTLSQSGNQVSGTISAQGISVGSVSGTYENGQYNLRIRLQAEGQVFDCGLFATVSEGRVVSGTIRYEGENYPFRLVIDGNRLVSQ